MVHFFSREKMDLLAKSYKISVLKNLKKETVVAYCFDTRRKFYSKDAAIIDLLFEATFMLYLEKENNMHKIYTK